MLRPGVPVQFRKTGSGRMERGWIEKVQGKRVTVRYYPLDSDGCHEVKYAEMAECFIEVLKPTHADKQLADFIIRGMLDREVTNRIGKDTDADRLRACKRRSTVQG